MCPKVACWVDQHFATSKERSEALEGRQNSISMLASVASAAVNELARWHIVLRGLEIRVHVCFSVVNYLNSVCLLSVVY